MSLSATTRSRYWHVKRCYWPLYLHVVVRSRLPPHSSRDRESYPPSIDRIMGPHPVHYYARQVSVWPFLRFCESAAYERYRHGWGCPFWPYPSRIVCQGPLAASGWAFWILAAQVNHAQPPKYCGKNEVTTLPDCFPSCEWSSCSARSMPVSIFLSYRTPHCSELRLKVRPSLVLWPRKTL